MIKSTIKILLFVSIVLAIGQFPVGKGTVGSSFVVSVKQGCEWGGRELMQSKWLSGIQLPGFIKENIPQKPAGKKKSELKLEEDVSKSDREAMLKLLQ